MVFFNSSKRYNRHRNLDQQIDYCLQIHRGQAKSVNKEIQNLINLLTASKSINSRQKKSLALAQVFFALVSSKKTIDRIDMRLLDKFLKLSVTKFPSKDAEVLRQYELGLRTFIPKTKEDYVLLKKSKEERGDRLSSVIKNHFPKSSNELLSMLNLKHREPQHRSLSKNNIVRVKVSSEKTDPKILKKIDELNWLLFNKTPKPNEWHPMTSQTAIESISKEWNEEQRTSDSASLR